ncbi:hypothetical protein [Kitasatospora kifunensis]|uniref:WD40 repeat protein n=1 Tax=Kitasatospora kifunensis TaxID=58351 RepID=A0A7W7R8E6_KITKI|nr:hypothetical protein [Kitasatospora kifunensis]MBB4927318.1 WD40 repeat protein [Kitasatospora kifunensis]
MTDSQDRRGWARRVFGGRQRRPEQNMLAAGRPGALGRYEAPHEAGSESAGFESAGSESAGSESVGSESAGSESAGSESVGSESAGFADALAAVTTAIELADQARNRGDLAESERQLRTAVRSSIAPYRQLAELRLGGLLSESGEITSAVALWLRVAEGPDPQLRQAVTDQLGHVPFVDAEFMVNADPATMTRLLPEAWGSAGRLGAAVYQASAYRHRDAGPAVRRQLLALDAARYGSQALAARIAAAPVPDEPGTPWRVAWASGNQLGGFRWTATGHEAAASAVATAMLDGRPIAVTGGGDGTVRVWDLATGAPLGEPMTGHTGKVWTVATGELAGRPVAISGGTDKAVRVWDLTTRQLLHEPLTGHRSWVTGLATAEVRHRPAVISCSDDRTVRVWDLATGAPLGEPLSDRSGPGSPLGGRLRAVATVELGRRTIAVTGETGGVVRVWDLTKGRQLQPLADVDGEVEALTTAVRDGGPIVVVGDSSGTTTMWELASGAQLGEPLTSPVNSTQSVAMAQVGDRRLVVTAGLTGMVRLWDPGTGQQSAQSFAAPRGGVWAVATAVVDGQPVAIVGCDDGTVRRWDLPSAPAPGKPLPGHGDTVNSLTTAVLDGVSDGTSDGVSDGNNVVVSTSWDGTARLWDLATGTAVGKPFADHDDLVYGVATAVLDGRRVIVTGGRDQWVRVWDPGTGAQVGEPLEHDTGVAAVATAVLGGRPIAVTGSWRGTVEVWDLTTRQPLYEPLTGHEADVSALATAVVDGRPVAVTGSTDGTARIWDLATGTAIGGPLRGLGEPGPAHQEDEEDEEEAPDIAGVATVELDGRPVAVIGSTDGVLRVWDLATGTPLGEPLTVAEDWLTAVAAGMLDGRPVVVAGGEDGRVRTWDLATRAQLGPDLVLPLRVGALAVARDGRLAVGFDWEVAVFGPPAPADTV